MCSVVFEIGSPLPDPGPGFLLQENHPELPLIKLKQHEVNAAWERLLDLALQRQETLSGAADLQRFRRYAFGQHVTGNAVRSPCLYLG